jgi:TolB protein
MWWVFCVVLIVCGTVPCAFAQIKLDVYGPSSSSLPIAIAPLKTLAGAGGQRLGEEFADIVARDLDISGLFRVIDRGTFSDGPEGIALEEINFQNWSDLGALALVKGGYSLDGDGLVVEVRLFDVAQRKQLGGKRYRGERKDLRRMAHRFADQILLMLTGELGPFDSRIAFVSNRAGGRAKEIYITDLTGSAVTQMTKDRTLNLVPSWNPAANTITYCSYKQGGPFPFRLDLRTGEQSRLYPVVGYNGGRWSPDGTMIAVSLEQDGNSDLFLLTAEGRLLKRLTEYGSINVSPTWSPDGGEIAFCSSRGGGPQVYVMNVESGRVRRLTFRGDYNTSPAWSPKGDLIAYTSRAGGFRIMTVAARGGDPHEVAVGEDPSWSPDGRYVVFSYRGRLRIASKDGRSVKQLTGGGGDDTSPAWSPRLE